MNTEENSILAANDQFYAALNAMFKGEVEPMNTVWSHADDATYMGPDGVYVVGWKGIGAEWKKQADYKLGGTVEPADIHTIPGHMLAVVQNYEIGQNLDKDGNKLEVKIRATNVFRKEKGEWKMISHHVDLLPFLMEK
ncbi:YybH family protein [Cerasicoccus arenae]|nr:nuclear transport factor 2 family protein [Cerasicoccus arenae]MBK1859545.1 nuclear transport factor 2 family protein [Cerasicoccus arenae]